MRGNRRYVMSRTNRRVPPTDSDEAGSLPSVDTDFLRKLIKTGDTGFIDDLVGKETSCPTPSALSSRDDELKYMKPSRRWPYVLFGMGLMYFFIVMTEARKTKNWWQFYMSNLKSSQSTSYDSMGLRGSSSLVEVIEVPPSNLFKSAAWEESGATGGFFASNGQQQQQRQQPQQQQYPRIAEGLSSGLLGQQQQSGATSGGLTSNRLQQQQQQQQQGLQYPRISGGFNSGAIGQQQQVPQIARAGINSGSSGLQPNPNARGGYVSQAASAGLFERTNNGNAMVSSLGGGGQFLQSSTNSRVIAPSGSNNGGGNMQFNKQPQSNGQVYMAGNFRQQDIGQ